MKKFLALIIAVMMFLGIVSTVYAVEMTFTDVHEDDWYYEDVKYAVENGLINGRSKDRFVPEGMLTYAETIKLAACMNQLYYEGAVTIASGEPWYQPYVDYCREKEIIADELEWTRSVSRSEYIAVFAKALPEEAFEQINNIPDGSILDVNADASYYEDVYKMYRAGIVTGSGAEHRFMPNERIKRAEVAAILTRMMNEDERVKFDLSEFKGIIKNEGTINDTDYLMYPAIEIKKEKDENEPENAPIPNVPINTEIVVDNNKYELSPLTIYKQPESSDGEEYGSKYELEVQVYGGKAPYSYQWFYYIGYRNEIAEIENGNYVKDVTGATLILSIEKENTLLGKKIYCEITDSEGTTAKTDLIKVYGPFSMTVDESLIDAGKYTLVGRVEDGVLKKGEKVSVIRDGKVIAIGVAEDLQMFNKSMDETVKGEYIGLIFSREDGVRPVSGDIVVKYQSSHIIDTSDIVN